MYHVYIYLYTCTVYILQNKKPVDLSIRQMRFDSSESHGHMIIFLEVYF